MRKLTHKKCRTDVWLGEVSFRVRFSRLFDLSMFKGLSVYDMCQLGRGEGEAWRWRRRLFAWEEEGVRELMLLLHNVILQDDKDDMWLWTLESSKTFSVCSAYNFQLFNLLLLHRWMFPLFGIRTSL
jgi:hypothetical protein